ncbi:MAG TPA: rhomboid family intramembrane serine protease [Pseudolabrys sp.]|nr:rhomboid family intramembrane serine protease [Pseudolabrys sp.]
MKREPAFNVPSVIIGLLAILAAIHFVRTALLTPGQNEMMLALMAFDPIRYEASLLPGGVLPGGLPAEIWTFFTYSLIHASWIHYSVNAIWLLPFGSAVARRFGPWRFMAFFVVTAVAGALAHLMAYAGQNAPVVGASAAISGTMAGAMRFAFQPGGPLHFLRTGEDADYNVPALPLTGVLRDPRVLLFLAVWFGINLVFGTTSLSMGTGLEPGQTIAWQAHIGGFVAGLLLFTWFDPAPQPAQGNDS